MQISLLSSQLNTNNSYKQNSLKIACTNRLPYQNKKTPTFGKSLITDVFEFKGLCRSPEYLNNVFEKNINKIWNKIQEQAEIFTPQKLETAISEVKSNNPKNSEEEILTVMQKLTQWANYSCFKPLANKLNDIGFKSIYISKPSEANDTFYYLLVRKKLCKVDYKNNCSYKFISKNSLNNTQRYLKNEKFINLEGFDDGVNFLTDDNLLAPLTNNVLTQVNNLRRKNIFLSFNKALNKVLNGKIESELKKKHFVCETIRLEGSPTRETILKQMSPVMPKSKESLKNIINVVANFFEPYAKNRNILLKTRLSQFYEQNIDVYTKQRLINLLKTMNENILKFQKEKNIPTENIYYLVANSHYKSDQLITRMFAKANKIPNEKIVFDYENIPKNKENSIVVILDDIAVTGDSLKKIKIQNPPENQHILYCPLICHSTALNNKNEDISKLARSANDKILNAVLKLDETPESKDELVIFNYFKPQPFNNNVIYDNGFQTTKKLGQCTIFPYMAPDNNADIASFLLYKFIPEPEALKNKHLNFNDLIYKLQNIE